MYTFKGRTLFFLLGLGLDDMILEKRILEWMDDTTACPSLYIVSMIFFTSWFMVWYSFGIDRGA